MRLHLLVPLLATALSASADAQSWPDLIQARWPGSSILKVAEKDFETFVATQAPRIGKAGAHEAFLAAQHAAYGLRTNSRWTPTFALPARDQRVAAVDHRPEGLVREGPEPNGNPGQGGTPTAISCGDQADGVIDVGGDQDWWRFTMPFPGTFQALAMPGLAGAGLPGSVADTVVEVYDGALNLVAFNDDYAVQYTSAIARGAYSFCETELQPGTYYVAVRAFGATQTGTYSLDLRCLPPFKVVAEGPEPNDDPTLGGTPTPLNPGSQGDGEVSPTGDHDWWQIDILQPTSLILVTGPSLSRGGAIVDSTLELFDATGGSLATDDDGGPAAYSQISITLQPGRYYADVAGFNGRPGTYRIYAHVVPTPSNPIAEAAEPNGDPRNGGSPTAIACDQFGAGEIVTAGGSPPTGDDDWWTFTMTQAGWVTVFTLPDSTGTSTSGALGDTEVWIYDSLFNQVAYDDDNGVGLLSEAAAWLTPGVYFANVEGYGGANIGKYLLKVECAGGLPGFATIPAGCPRSNGVTPSITTRDLELAVLGSTFVADFVGLPANATVFPLIGLSMTRTTVGNLNLPIDLGVLGAPGCLLASDPLAALTLPTTAYGSASLALGIPLDPTLTGAVLYTQAVVLDAAANAFGLVTSDVGAIIVGDRL
jgi:hypothetical protein